MSSYAHGSAKHFDQRHGCVGDEGDEPTVHAGGDGEGGC